MHVADALSLPRVDAQRLAPPSQLFLMHKLYVSLGAPEARGWIQEMTGGKLDTHSSRRSPAMPSETGTDRFSPADNGRAGPL